LLAYLLSFVVVMVMWVNHHHLMFGLREVTPRALWLNANLLFWMSLIPFVTAWMGANHRAPVPAALYGADLAMCALGFLLLRGEVARQVRHDAVLSRRHRRLQGKTAASLSLYALSIPIAFAAVPVAQAIFVLIPALYFIPERTE
jgi:uncharacterized membrane protein